MENKTSIKVMLNTVYGVRPQEATIANNRLCYQMAVCLIKARTHVCLLGVDGQNSQNSRNIYADTDSVKCVAMDD